MAEISSEYKQLIEKMREIGSRWDELISQHCKKHTTCEDCILRDCKTAAELPNVIMEISNWAYRRVEASAKDDLDGRVYR